MKLSSRASALSAGLQERLNTYALAAGAAGVSVLTLAASSKAEIVYTPVNQIIVRDGHYAIDLNHDGTIDYVIQEQAGHDGSFGSSQRLSARPALGNQVKCDVESCFSDQIYAAALFRGDLIGSSQGGWLSIIAPMADEARNKRGSVVYSWAWVNVNDRYLGLQIQVDGEIHYGWARLSVKFKKGAAPKDRTWEAHLTGYAYETVPEKPITAGQMGHSDEVASGPEASIPFSRSAPLGVLALGAAH